MRAPTLTALALVLCACGSRHSEAEQIANFQAKSAIGPTATWKLDPALPQPKVQDMRDRAYRFCLNEKTADRRCLGDQDHSLFQYSNSFRLVRIFRSEGEPTLPFAKGHKDDPAAFERILQYCSSVYEDQGSSDARALGPCMSAGLGSDFFGIVPVS